MVQDRISIVTGGRSRVMLGRQTFLNCAALRGYGHGCDGGGVGDVLQYMEKYGLPDETCL
jgi:cathepsin X